MLHTAHELGLVIHPMVAITRAANDCWFMLLIDLIGVQSSKKAPPPWAGLWLTVVNLS